ncbi:hypothetical protein D0N43_20310 [Klebsiella aerogenes]|jgi:hypothetical protein|uniref:Uncharacterized protein n=1 Tax=Klebsiella aerogenes (strain ATCC 13048 / DSM 30053 / CCUG 1429 / JCM 1235 / KCTC 2190 / NBRC 13534 / NCIMB 10102 / NCTC 10006 / CDC 819-56) TaxID=1028307 RepID=A0A0H3FMH5_KLEAK|nr:hypothetical protein EAE_08530 [Klebsiella aerogenes KCTC 2190]KLF42847.1 hypothetical protein YA32_09800 [Klebsiella aerogenes]KLF45960.1 hypothetical protein YA33_06895 [Klebsiella aerogenes]KZQ47477.1 hypothetical protein A3N58_01535 [Klebsiella aerogenes]MBE0184390.1 hypothetical protein [Klebsiella aerogenes]
MVAREGKKEDEKNKKLLIYVPIVIIFFLIIPEIILRTLSSDQLGRVSDFTSLGGCLIPSFPCSFFLDFFPSF